MLCVTKTNCSLELKSWIFLGPVIDVEAGKAGENNQEKTKLEQNILLSCRILGLCKMFRFIGRNGFNTFPTPSSSSSDQADFGLDLSLTISPSSLIITP